MNDHLIFNGSTIRASEPFLDASSPGFRLGDGLFETICFINGEIRLASFHFDRLFHGMEVLSLPKPANFSGDVLSRQIIDLCKQNHLPDNARVRLTVFRGSDLQAHYLIETQPLPPLETDPINASLYTKEFKSTGFLSNTKNNNYLLYILALRDAKARGFDEAIVLNQHGRICESNRSNIFLVRAGLLYTPRLSEGCVAGVMRRHLLKVLPTLGYEVVETLVSPEQIAEADEVFLTNAIHPIRAVGKIDRHVYENSITASIAKAIKWK